MKRASGFCALSALLLACGGGGDTSNESTAATTDGLVVSANASEDSYVTTYDNVPRGAYTNVRVGAGTLKQETYLKFAVSGVPAGAVNVSATLKLHANASSSDAIEAHLAKSSAWSESTLSEQNAPGAQPAVLATATGTTAGSWTSFDVSSAVTGNGTVSFVLSTPSGTIVDFASHEAGAATAPTLSVSYQKPAARTLFGVAFAPHDDARHTQLVSELGGVQVIRSYDGGSGVSPFLNGLQAEDLRWGAVSNYSFKYPPTSVTSGAHDTELRSFFNGIADNHPTYWTYWHEPDDELYKTHQFTPAEYRAAWAHIKNIADAVKATRPHLQAHATFIMMSYSMEAKIAPGRPLLGPNGMYPGDDVIDVFGVDAYNSAAASGGITDAATQFAPAIDFAQAHKKPWAIGELGSIPVKGNPSGRATYIKNAITYWNTRQAPVYVAYFDLVYNGNDYTLDGDAAADSVWRKAVSGGGAGF